MSASLTPEAQAALVKLGEAALDHVADGFANILTLTEAAEAYRATLVPKECRPPSDNRYWWLTNEDGDKEVMSWTSDGRWWQAATASWMTTVGAAENGWTVFGPCEFPGERAEATDEALRKYWTARTGGIGFVSEASVQFWKDMLHHFRSKRREISDEKIDLCYLDMPAHKPDCLISRLRIEADKLETFPQPSLCPDCKLPLNGFKPSGGHAMRCKRSGQL